MDSLADMPEELSEDLVSRVLLRVKGSVVAIDEFLGTCEVGREFRVVPI